jgi:ankyrin repeat protein
MLYRKDDRCCAFLLGCWHKNVSVKDVDENARATLALELKLDGHHMWLVFPYVPMEKMKPHDDADVLEPTDAQLASSMFLAAAYHTDVSLARAMLRRDDVDSAVRGAHGVTALMIGCQKGHLGFVELLLNTHASSSGCRAMRSVARRVPAFVDEKDESGKTALMHAVAHHAILKVLLAAGADTACTMATNGCNVLMLAACAGDPHVVRLLAPAMRDLDGKSNEGLTALDLACAADHHDAALLLLDAGATPTPTAMMFAGQCGTQTLLRRLLAAGGPVNAVVDTHGRTPLMCAARGDDAAAIHTLVAAGAEVDTYDNEGWTALMHAARANNVAGVRALLGAGAHHGARPGTPVDRTPLMVAAQCNALGVLRVLCTWNLGVDKDESDNEGWTALIYAAAHGHRDAARILLQARAHANAADEDGWTPLAYAAQTGYADVVAALLATEGILIDYEDDIGRTPLMHAIAQRHPGVVQMLLDAGAVVEHNTVNGHFTPLVLAAQRGVIATVHALLKAGAEVDRPSVMQGTTALIAAAEKGSVPIVRALLDAGADPRRTNWAGRTALTFTCCAPDVAKMLIRRGAPLDVDGMCCIGTRCAIYWEKMRRAVRARPYALHWLEDYARRTYAPESEHMDYQRAAWAEDARECELVYLRAQVRELKKKRKRGDEEAVVRCRLGM